MLRTLRHIAAAGLFLSLILFPASRFDRGRPHIVMAQATNPCLALANDIVTENCKTGTPSATWDIAGAGDPNIQGFATQISMNRGGTATFKVDFKYASGTYHLDIYRMGYYGGMGARFIASVPSTSVTPKTQGACLTEAPTGLIDCGNWADSASWLVPADAVSGIYFAKVVGDNLPAGAGSGVSHVVFIVRNDARASDLLFQTSDTTWQAYNDYGGNSLYAGGPAVNPARAYKVSYNRPFHTRAVDGGQDWLFNSEYPMVRFLEANGYDMTYVTGVDVDRGINGQNPLLNHKVFMSVGHDEYWSGQQRKNAEDARAAGINIAFFSGNAVFWKTRWEGSIDATATGYRTLVCYKETHAAAKIDTANPTIWTGTWRDQRSFVPADGRRPENALSGTSFAVNDSPTSTNNITVPSSLANMRFWRGLKPDPVSALSTPLPFGVLGYEWDEDPDNGFRPSGLFHLSSTTLNMNSRLLDEGSQYGPGTVTHNLTLYRAPAPSATAPGALVFGAGTVQWAWGLDAQHDRNQPAPNNTPADSRMQQATINLLADMGVQPAGTLLSGLTTASKSIDTVPPASTITRPNSSAPIPTGRTYRITGTSTDTNGIVAGVEVSTDGGATWHAATGTTSWSYNWIPVTTGTVVLMVRAVDDSGNIETPVQRSVQVISGDPNVGPGGPILVVTSTANPFTRYYAEILRNEGVNEFALQDIGAVTATTLNAYVTVILGQMPLTAAQVDMFTQWVNAGGNLIAMRPDKQLYPLLGLAQVIETPTSPAATKDAYLLFNRSMRPAAGLVGETIQFHGDADFSTLTSAQGLATLYSNATTATNFPAVTLRAVGTAGGHAAAFMFDLARSVVYIRQGNPAWSGQERDGKAPIRSNDLYYGAKVGDLQPDWIDLAKVAIPQADEQQRLLANLIFDSSISNRPLPRFWYFPKGKKAVIVMTGDDHANGGTSGRFQKYMDASPAGCSVDNWDCVRSSSYIYPNSTLTDAQAASFQSNGFEIGVHVDTNCADWTPQSLENFYTSQLGTLHDTYPSLFSPVTHRVHCVVWTDYSTQPELEARLGIRLDTSYYYWPPEWLANRPGMFTGSGMPMRYTKMDGTMIDVYQAATQLTDESQQTFPFTVDALLNKALGPEAYYGAFAANMHTDYNERNTDGKNSLANSNAIVSSAQSRGVPVVSSKEMLEWLDGRNESSFSNMTWDAVGRTLSFSIVVGGGANNLQAMLPTRSGSLKLNSLTRAGTSVTATFDTIKGVEYAFFPAVASSYQATYVVDNTPPVISNLTAKATSTSTAVMTWTTNEPATSRVDFGRRLHHFA
jgi:hypothetical protein